MRREPQAAQTKRFTLAMFGKGVAGARPIALKLIGVERRQSGLLHVTQLPERLAILGEAIGMSRRIP